MSVRNTYRTIVRTPSYSAEIYDNCRAVLQGNGRRYRVKAGGTRWVGNTGGYHEYVRYLTIDQGRALLRRYRRAHLAELRGRDCYEPGRVEVLTSAASGC